jgi:hypothetical protein
MNNDDHYLRLRMNVERGVNGAGGAQRVHEADGVDRFALELAGEVDAMPLWSHMAATLTPPASRADRDRW